MILLNVRLSNGGKMVLLFYFWMYMCTICVNFLMIFYILKNRCANGATAFVGALLSSSLWCFASAMQNSFPGLNQKILWSQIGFPAYTFGPLFWFIMTLEITDHRQWLNHKKLVFLCIIPIVTVILVFTNSLHGLIWMNIHIKTVQNLAVLSEEHGLWFYVHAAYSDGLNVISVILAVRFWHRKAPLYGNHYASLSFSMLFVILINLAFVLRIGPPVDLTPIAWGFASLFITRALFWNKLFDLMPIARERIMESLSLGIVILDLKGRIADFNPAAATLFERQAHNVVGMDAYKFLEEWLELQRQAAEHTPHIEFKTGSGQNVKCFESSCMETKHGGKKLGWILMIRDISEQKNTQFELLKSQRENAVQEERMRMARDLHDDLGQILGFINVQAQAVQGYLEQDRYQEANACLARLSEIARETHNRVRETIQAMRGETEEAAAGNFKKRLEYELKFFEQNTAIRVHMDFSTANKTNNWNSKHEMQVLKIIRESLNNIRIHSEATEISVTCDQKDKSMTVTVSDNGRGFDTSLFSGDHYGIAFMRERAAEIGGSMRIDSKIGQGTSVALVIPLTDISCGEKVFS